MLCDDCTFSNLSFQCKQQELNAAIYGFVGLQNTRLLNVEYTTSADSSCSSWSFAHLTSEENSITFTNLQIFNYVGHTVFFTDKTELSFDGLTIRNMSVQNSFLEDISGGDSSQSVILSPLFQNCNISHFYGTAIVKTGGEWGIDYRVQNCYIEYLAQKQHNPVSDSLFWFGSGWNTMQDVVIEYNYDLDANCRIQDDHLLSTAEPVEELVLVECLSPICAIRSDDDAELIHVEFVFTADYEAYEQRIFEDDRYSNVSVESLTINYRFYQNNSQQFLDALILNYDDMHIRELIATPATFHDVFILDIGEDWTFDTLLISGPEDERDFNRVLTSNYLYIYDSQQRNPSDQGAGKSFVNCQFRGVKHTLMHIDTTFGENTIEISNSMFSDAWIAMYLGVGTEAENYRADSWITVQQTQFTDIGVLYLDLYAQNDDSIGVHSVNELFTLYSVNFTDCSFEMFSDDAHFIDIQHVQQVILVDNVFTTALNSDAYVYVDDEYTMKQSIVQISNAEQRNYVVSNHFNTTHYFDSSVPALYLHAGQGTNCLTGNIFYNLGLLLNETNITSCYRPDAFAVMHSHDMDIERNVFCENHIGGVFSPLSDLFGYWYLDDTVSNPIEIHKGNRYDDTVVLDNIKFVLSEDRNVVFYDRETDGVSTHILLYDAEIVYSKNMENYEVVPSHQCFAACIEKLSSESSPSSANTTATNATVPFEIDYFRQMHIMCGGNHSALKSDEFQVKYVDHLLPSYVELQPTTGEYKYFPGQPVTFRSQITDRLRNPVSNFTSDLFAGSTIWNQPYNNTITLNLYYISRKDSFKTLLARDMIIFPDGTCSDIICDQQSILTEITLFDAENDTVIFGQDLSQTLNVLDLVLNITNCPSGYKISDTGLYCAQCPAGQFSVHENSQFCHSCPTSNDAVRCEGANNVFVLENYWMDVIENEAVQQLSIITGICPSGYCCSDGNGCNYFQNLQNQSYDGTALCGLNRNHHQYLCGDCMEGYSEVYGTASCLHCARDYLERLLLPIFYGLAWAIFILFARSYKIRPTTVTDSRLSTNSYASASEKPLEDVTDEEVESPLTRSQYLDAMEIMLTKIMLYYYQSISYVLISTGVKVVLSGFVGLCNLNIFSISSQVSDSGVCLLSEMNAIQKILFELTTTGSILFFIFIIWILSLFHVNACQWFNRKVHFGQAFVKATLVCIGQIFATLFLLLACRTINDVSVHYYFGSQECFGPVWIVSIVVLVVIVILASIGLYSIYRSRSTHISQFMDERQMRQHWYYPVVSFYDQKYWYWEYVLFLRRLVLALIFVAFDNDRAKFAAACLLIVYLFWHLHCNPFSSVFVNRLESYLIASLSIIIFLNQVWNTSMYAFNNVVISLLILLPVGYFVRFAVRYHKSLKNVANSSKIQMYRSTKTYDDDEEDDDDEKDIETVVPAPDGIDGDKYSRKASLSENTAMAAQDGVRWSMQVQTDTEHFDDDAEVVAHANDKK